MQLQNKVLHFKLLKVLEHCSQGLFCCSMKIISILALVLLSYCACAQTDSLSNVASERQTKGARLTALVLNIATGPIGGHRIYLGTHPRVPIVYALTLGGGLGLLPLIDLGYILFTKDLTQLCDNPNVFIWRKE